jgi:hypothetical protein
LALLLLFVLYVARTIVLIIFAFKPVKDAKPEAAEQDVKPIELDVAGKGAALREAYIRLYSQNQYIRDVMLKILTAAVGVMGIADGWLIARTKPTDLRTRCVMCMGFCFVAVIASYSIRTHYREYVANAAMIVRVERALGFYTPGIYTTADSLYEIASSKWGTGIYSKHILQVYEGAILLIAVFSVAVGLLV